MNLEEVSNYLIKHKGMNELDAYGLAMELDGKSMAEVDARVDEVYLTGIPTDITQVNQVYLTGIPTEVNQVNLEKFSQVNISVLPEPINKLMSIKVTKSLKDRIKQQATELGLPVSTLIRVVLIRYFKQGGD